MQLRDAIAKAAKFAWKGKQRSPTKCVRFMPGGNDYRSALFATDGPQGILIWLDQDVPNVMIDAEKLAAALKGVKQATIEQVVNQTVVISGVRLEGGNVNEYPAIPRFPESNFQKLQDWWTIEKLLHAVSKDPQQPILQCLHFRHDLVETTDRFRVARAFVRTPWEGLVPAATFRHWPDGDVHATFGEDLAAFRVGDELRFTRLKRGAFQDCDQLLPPWHEGSRAIVATKVLIDSVKRAKALAGACRLTIDAQMVQVEGGGFKETTLIHRTIDAPEKPVTIHVNSTWLLEALRNVSTDRVVLGYTDSGDPLRIESGPYVVGLWPFTGG